MKTVKVTLKRDDLLYDINSIAFFTGRSRAAEGNDEMVANMQSGEEEADLISRFMLNATDEIKPRLSAVLKQVDSTVTSEHTTSDSGAETFVYDLVLNDNFDMNQSSAVASGIHEFVVNRTVSDWFGIANPNEMKIYFDRAELALTKVLHAMNRRVKPLRRKPTP